MAETIKLAKNLELPARAITESIAIMGRKGSGKTYSGTLLFEQFYAAGAQCVAIDPIGKWWGLRVSASGKGKGLDIPVFGGVNGDIPVTPESGRLLATVVVERRLSCVIDLLLFSKRKRRDFVTAFAEQLFELKKRQQSPLHLFVEEARKFVPQKPQKGDERMLGAFEDIARLGRNFGLGVSLVDQRPQSVNKEVLSQTEILIAHQLVHNLDKKAIREWVSSNDADGIAYLSRVNELEPGHAFLWSPGLLKKFAEIKVNSKRTLDTSATPELGDGGDGGKLAAPRPLSADDLAELRAGMAEVVEAAEGADPRKLQSEIRRLEREVTRLQGELEHRPAETVEVPAIAAEDVQEVERLYRAARDLHQPAAASLAQMADALDRLVGLAAPRVNAAPIPAPAPARAPRRDRRPAPAAAESGFALLETVLSGPEQRILNALAWLEDVGVDSPEIAAVAFIAGYKPGGGAFNNPRGKLRGRGLLEYLPGKRMRLTAGGNALALRGTAPGTTDELHRRVLERLGGPEQRILQPLLDVYPDSLGNAELAERAGYAVGGAFNNPRGRLRTLGLIDYPERGRVVARDLLFLEADRG